MLLIKDSYFRTVCKKIKENFTYIQSCHLELGRSYTHTHTAVIKF